jgi:membrane protein
MASQALAFNMFLAFFPSLLVALGPMSSYLSEKNGQELAMRLSAILPLAAGSSYPISCCAEK